MCYSRSLRACHSTVDKSPLMRQTCHAGVQSDTELEFMPETVNKFTRIKARLRGTAANDIPAPFETACECGHRIAGTRSRSWQQQVCPDCHAKLYVLPVNVYPSTPSVPSEVIGGSFLTRLKVLAGELLSQQRNEVASPSREDWIARESDPADSDSSSASGVREISEPISPASARLRRPKLSLPRIDLTDLARRTFTPFRIIMASMVLVVGATSTWIWHRSTEEAAHRTWLESMDQIPELLAAHDLVSLETVLSDALDAGRVLDRNGAEWRETVNLLAETQVVQDVSPVTLPSLLMNAADENDRLLPERMRSLPDEIMNGSFVIDGFVDPSGNADGSLLVDIPVMPGGFPVHMTLTLPVLNELLEISDSGRIVFAFRCSDVRLPSESRKERWEIRLDPASFVLITSPMHCRQLGFAPEDDPSLSELLSVQKNFVRDSEHWARRHERWLQTADNGATK